MKRLLSFVLVLAMLLCAIPFAVSAVEESVPENGEQEASYIDLYVKSGLVSLFTAYDAQASDTAVTSWAPVALAGKAGYSSYIEDSASLAGTWKYKDGTLYSSYSGAYMNLTPLIEKVGTTYAIQTVYQMTAPKKATTANIETQTVTDESGAVSTKNVVTNYTSLTSGAESHTACYYGLLRYGTLFAYRKYTTANRTLFDCWFTQITGGSSTYNMMFLGDGLSSENGIRNGTYYYTDTSGAEQSFTAYRSGLPSHMQELTVTRLGDAIASGTKVNVSYKLYWQFYPTRRSSSAHSSRTLSYTASGTADSSTVRVLSGINANNYSVRVYNRELSTDEINRNHLADLCGYYGTDVSVLVNMTNEQIQTIADAFINVKMYHDRADAAGYAAAQANFEAELNVNIASVIGDENASYIDLYVKSGLVALFDALSATASNAAVKLWEPVDLYGKPGYDSYIDYEYTDDGGATAYAYTPTLNGTWKWKNGAIHSSYSGASFALSSLGALLGSTYSVQTVYGMTAINGYTRADISTVTVENTDGTTTAKNVINNYSSLASGAKTLGTMNFGLFSYATLYFGQKTTSANNTLMDSWFVQLKGSSNTNIFFHGSALENDNGFRWMTFYYNNASGTETSFSANYCGAMPAHIQEVTVSRLGEATVSDSNVTVPYSIYWQFYPNRKSSSNNSSHSLSYTAKGTADSTALTVLAGLEADNYAVRVYNRQLSVAEINRNHFADICGFYGVNASPLAFVSEVSIDALASEYTTVKLLADKNDASFITIKNELQKKINALCLAESTALDTVLSSLIGFDCYSFRVSGKYGIRAIFSLNSKIEAQLDALGYTLLSYGAVTAIHEYDGKTYNEKKDLVLTPASDGSVALDESIRGAAVVNSTDEGFKTLSDDGEKISFAYTVTYPTTAEANMFDIQLLYRGYAVLENADGEITVYYADIPENTECSSLYKLHQKVLTEYGTNYRDTLGYDVYCYLYDVLMKVMPSKYTAQTREKAWAIAQKVTPLTLTQAERIKNDDYSYVQAYADFYRLAEENAILPALSEGYVPQGLSHDPSNGYTYVSAYHYSGAEPSIIAVLDEYGTLVAEYLLYKADGSEYTGHVGGIAVSESALYVSYSYSVMTIPLDELTLGGSQRVTLSNSFAIPVQPSFLYYEDGILWAGNYYAAGSSDYPLGKHFNFTTMNADGTALGSYALAYRLEGDLMPNQETFTDSNGTEYTFAAPNHVIALSEKVQGFAYKNGTVILSTSLAGANSHLYVHTADITKASETISLYGREYPMTVLSSESLANDIVALPMSQGIDFTANGRLLVSFESGASKFSYSYPTDNIWSISLPHIVTEQEKLALDGKKIIFIGDSFIYWGQVVLDSSASRYNDQGYFYQLCKANGIDVSVTNWTYGGKSISYIYENYMGDLADYNYDYVVISGGRNSASNAETYFDVLQKYKTLFESANPDVKFFYNVSSGAHNISVAESFPVEILNNLDEFEKMGYTIVDWGKLVADVIRDKVAVPGGEMSYEKNTFIVDRSDADGYHPNQLTGYLTSLMVYCAITGASAEGQTYSFWNDTSANAKFDADGYIANYYTHGTTNYKDIFASPADMRGLQKLIDKYLAEKAYLNYNFTSADELETIRVLFIGNSYTYYNDMPTAIFRELGNAAGLTLDVTAITKGAHTLAKFADPNDTYGALVEAELSGDTHYDYVIIQEQSVLPAAENASAFYDAVRNLAARIRAAGASPILYATWGRKTGSDTLATYGWTNESMTWRLAASYAAIGAELNIPVAFAGLAFYDVYTSESGIELYDPDLSHPSYAGSYLAAATLLAKIFGIDTTALNYYGSLTEEAATVLLKAAHDAVTDTPTIPEEYRRSSVAN